MMKLDAEKCFVSPCRIIKTWLFLLDRFGDKTCLEKSEFKSAREHYISALFTLGLTERYRKDFWIRIHPNDSTPDASIISLNLDSKNRCYLQISSLEFFEWEAHSKLTLIEAIRRKLDKKAYPTDYNLLCYCHDRTDEIDLIALFEAFRTLHASIGEIWVLSNIGNILLEKDFHGVARIYPDLMTSYFNAIEQFENKKDQTEIIVRHGESYFAGEKILSSEHSTNYCFEYLPVVPVLSKRVMLSQQWD
jgi:hypothetical protein